MGNEETSMLDEIGLAYFFNKLKNLFIKKEELDEIKYTLPIATSTVLGGIMANERTSNDTVEVKVDSEGFLYVPNKLETARLIDGVYFDGSSNIHHYGTCGTTGATAAKTVSITNFSLVTGAKVMVRFTYANTATSPTLNVNSTGAKSIRYKNASVPTGYIMAGTVLELVYSGSYWYIVGDLTQSQVNTLTDTVNAFTTFDAEDVTDSFNWGSCEDYKAYRIGKVVFFRATCTTKSASTMTFATIADTSLYPSSLGLLNSSPTSWQDIDKKTVCYVYTDGGIKLTTYTSYTSNTSGAITGNVLVCGHWFIA